MGSTEQQRQFARINYGEEDRPGVMQTPRGGTFLDVDWYNIITKDDDTYILRTDSGKDVCTTTDKDTAFIMLEALNMRAEHFALRAYGRIHGKLPTQHQLGITERLLNEKTKELEEAKDIIHSMSLKHRVELTTAERACMENAKLKLELGDAYCKHARRYSQGYMAWDKRVSARWSK